MSGSRRDAEAASRQEAAQAGFGRAVRRGGVTRRALLGAVAAALVACSVAGCSGAAEPAGGEAGEAAAAVDVRVASLKGPTSIGLVSLMDKAGAGETQNNFEFTVSGTADEVVPGIIQGEYDIACVPANVASVLYNKTEGGITVIDVNTLGVLSVVTADETVQGFEDLAGRTVYMTGKGTTPEYVMSYLLEQAGIADSVTLEFKSEAAEVVSAIAADPTAVAVLPEPYTTAACSKNESLRVAVSLTDVWDQTVGEEGSRLLTGVTVVRNEFLEEHPEAVQEFLAEHAASVEAVNGDPAAAAPLVVEYGIVDAEAVAEKAIPSCNLVCLTGDEMKSALSGYLQVLYDADPASVGGELPGDDFYYAG